MDAVKGVFRRANQSIKEKSGKVENSTDKEVLNAMNRVRSMATAGNGMMDKVAKLSRAMEDVGALTIGIAEDYKNQVVEGLTAPEMVQLMVEMNACGQEIVGKAQELQRSMKENAYDNIGAFAKEVPNLKNLEEDMTKKQLEYDFFKNKVNELCRNPPKDSTRIPRNEGIRENWRQQHWHAQEHLKQVISNLHSNGMRSMDTCVYTVAMTLGNFSGYTVNSAKNHFVNARLPTYNTTPLLPPAQIPPPPPPFQQPQQQAYGGGQPPNQYGSPQQGQYGTQSQYNSPQGGQQQYGSPQQGGQPPTQQGHYSPPPQQGQQGQQQYNTQSPDNNSQQQGWNNNTTFGSQPSAPPQQPSQVNYGYDQQQQQQPPQQHQQHPPTPPAQQQQQYQQPQQQQQAPPQQQQYQQHDQQQHQQQGGAPPPAWNATSQPPPPPPAQ